MAFKKIFLSILAFWWPALILHQAQACICTFVVYTLCQKYDMSDAVMHGTPLSRNVTGDDATYTLDIITLYKEEENVTYSDEISFNTPASTDDCGVTLSIGKEYLIGLRDSDDDGVYTLSSCHGLYEPWSTEIEEEVDEC